MKTVRLAPRPQPQARPIKRFSPLRYDPPAPPKPMMSSAPSNKTAADVVRAAENPGSINPRQQVY